jgi:hypothetical protein
MSLVRLAIAGTFLLAAAAPVRADDWIPIGPAALGQGGAGVAAASGPGSVYWNPALPALEAPGILDLGTFGLGVEAVASLSAEGGVLKSGDALYDFYNAVDFPAIQVRLNAGTATVGDVMNAILLVDHVKAMDQDGEGAYLGVGASVELRLGWFTLFVHDRGWAGTDPIVDSSNISYSSGGIDALYNGETGGTIPGPLAGTAVTPSTAGGLALRNGYAGVLTSAGFGAPEAQQLANALAIQSETALGPALSDPSVVATLVAALQATAAGGGDLASNTTGFDVKGLNLMEYGVAVSVPVLERLLAVGLALKQVRGETSWARIYAVQTDNVMSEVKDNLDSHRKVTTRTNLDLGIAASPVEGLRLGLTGKNLIRTDFPLKGRPDSITLDPQVRAGAYWRPIDWVSFALDADLVRTQSDVLNGYESQWIGGGVGFHLFEVLVLRGGLMQNVAVDTSKPTFTAGLDLFIWKFRLGVAGAYAPSQVAVQVNDSGTDVEIPQRVSISAAVGFGLEW